MRSFAEVARIWAARRLKMPLERIGEVHFDADPGYYYSEITNADPHCYVTIEVRGYSRSPRTRYRDFHLLGEFWELLNDLVAIAQETESDSLEEAARTMGRVGGARGGPARAEALTPERRSEIARNAANTRWRNRGDNEDRVE